MPAETVDASTLHKPAANRLALIIV
jgi:hypothetical protein